MIRLALTSAQSSASAICSHYAVMLTALMSRSWCLLFLIVPPLTGDAVTSVSFTPVVDEFGTVLCAVDRPSFSVTVKSVEELTGLPYAIQCGYRCSAYNHDPPCTSFNVLSDNGLAVSDEDGIRCQMYTSPPQSLRNVSSCELYSVSDI